MKIKIDTRFVIFTSIFTLVFYVIALLFLNNIEPGWKMTRSYEKFSDKFSGCKYVQGAGSPTTWYEDNVLNARDESPRSIYGKLGKAQNRARMIHDGVFGEFFIPNAVQNGKMVGAIENIKQLECWAKHGDVLAMFAIAKYEHETTNIIKNGEFINNFEKPEVVDNYYEVRRYLDKMTHNVFLPFVLGHHSNSSCQKAYEKGILICSRTFPEAYFIRARLECNKENIIKSKKYFELAYKLGDDEANFYLSKSEKEFKDIICKAN